LSLAKVLVPVSDFEVIHDHVLNHYPQYRNMHLREHCQRDGERDLLYLHAMRAVPGSSKKLEGMISGPGLYWHYVLTQKQITVLHEPTSEKARKRIEKYFLTEILERVALERSGEKHYPKRKKGQFYLKRGAVGTPATHRHCVSAVATGALDRRFVSVLQLWNLELLCPS
jgi:hypothetical protein